MTRTAVVVGTATAVSGRVARRLKDQGILTEEEFAAEKVKILAS